MNTLMTMFNDSIVSGVPHVRAMKHDQDRFACVGNLAKDNQHRNRPHAIVAL